MSSANARPYGAGFFMALHDSCTANIMTVFMFLHEYSHGLNQITI